MNHVDEDQTISHRLDMAESLWSLLAIVGQSFFLALKGLKHKPSPKRHCRLSTLASCASKKLPAHDGRMKMTSSSESLEGSSLPTSAHRATIAIATHGNGWYC